MTIFLEAILIWKEYLSKLIYTMKYMFVLFVSLTVTTVPFYLIRDNQLRFIDTSLYPATYINKHYLISIDEFADHRTREVGVVQHFVDEPIHWDAAKNILFYTHKIISTVPLVFWCNLYIITQKSNI